MSGRHFGESSDFSFYSLYLDRHDASYFLTKAHILTSNVLADLKLEVLWTKSGHQGFTFGKALDRDNIHPISGISVPLITRDAGSTVKLTSTCIFGLQVFSLRLKR